MTPKPCVETRKTYEGMFWDDPIESDSEPLRPSDKEPKIKKIRKKSLLSTGLQKNEDKYRKFPKKTIKWSFPTEEKEITSNNKAKSKLIFTQDVNDPFYGSSVPVEEALQEIIKKKVVIFGEVHSN